MGGCVLGGGALSPNGDPDSSGRCGSGWDTAGPPPLLREVKDLSCRPRVGASHWEPGLSPAPRGPPTQTRTQIAAGLRCFQSADKSCSLPFLLFRIFKGTKFGVRAGVFEKLFLALERTMTNWCGERVVPRLSVDSHRVQESGGPSAPGLARQDRAHLNPGVSGITGPDSGLAHAPSDTV